MKQQATSNKQQATSNKQQATSNKQLLTKLLTLMLFLTLVNCQKEDTQNEPAANQVHDPKALNVTISNWQHFSEKNPGASQRIKAVQEKSALARNTESELYGFVIDTSKVQIIEQEGFTTYAFTAIRQQPIAGIMENYLYKQNNDGTYQQYLLGYYCTVDVDGNIQYTADDLLITPIDDPSLLSRDSCNPEFVQVDTVTVCVVGMTCYGPEADGRHTSASQCSCQNTPSTCYEPNTMVCNDRPIFGWSNCPGGLPEENPFDPSDPSNSGGTPTTTYTAPDGIVYTILEPHPALYEVLTCINGSNGQSSLSDPTTLNVDAQMIATMNAYWKPMSIYLQENACSPEAQAFSIAAIEAIENDGEVDLINEVIIDETFKDTETQCIHNLLKTNSGFYNNMLSNFSSEDARGVLVLKIGTTLNGEWGTTLGSYDNYNEFIITTNSSIETSSNLKKMVTLSHELIHAYMFSSLESWNLINYNVDGEPILNLVCVNGVNYNNLNLNSLNEKDRFVAIMCAFNQNGTLTEDWVHDLFNSWSFDTNTYRELLEDLLINAHNWDDENAAFKNEAINLFGENNWIEKVAEAISWLGLEETQEYSNYFNSITNPLEQLYIMDINYKIQTAKSNCL